MTLPSSFTKNFRIKLISPVLGSPVLDTVLWVWPHLCWVEEKDHLSQHAANNPSAARMPLALFCCKDTLLAHAQLVPQHNNGIISLQVQDFALLAKYQLAAHFSSLSKSRWMGLTRNWSEANRLVVPWNDLSILRIGVSLLSSNPQESFPIIMGRWLGNHRSKNTKSHQICFGKDL